jgi:DNA excision repair protein ERCC-2
MESASPQSEAERLFPYRLRPGQEQIVEAVSELGRHGGALLLDAATGSGKTVATLAPLIAHAEEADHRILYLVRTHSQEVQVLQEARAIARRLGHPIRSVSLSGRSRRCLLLENVREMKDATAEEHGKLCADRKRVTERGLSGDITVPAESDLPEGGTIDLIDLDGCPFYARVLQTEVETIESRLASTMPTPTEFEEFCQREDLCAYELSKRMLPGARIVTAPYAFFFHPFIRKALLGWMGTTLDRIDVVVDEAHNLPDYLRESATVALPQVSVRRAKEEVADRGDFQLPEGPSASRFLDVVQAAIEELVDQLAREDDGILTDGLFEDALLAALGGTSQRFDRWLAALVTWGENLREERRRERHLPRSWVYSVALALLSWPKLSPPEYVKLATRTPRPALEAYALDVSAMAAALSESHLSVHLSGTLAPLEEYRDALGLGEAARGLRIPSQFPSENRRILFDPTVTTRYQDLAHDPGAIYHLADRVASVMRELPVKTAIFFPSFDLMDRVLQAGLQASLPSNAVIETRRIPMADLWRSIDGMRKDPQGTVLLGVTGGRVAEGIDFPGEDLEAVVVVGIPYPKPTAKREALRQFWEARTGSGWAYAFEAPAQRAILQAIGRMIRSEHDRGIAILLDRRAAQFQTALPGLAPIGDIARTAREFYGPRTRRITQRPRLPPTPSPPPRTDKSQEAPGSP